MIEGIMEIMESYVAMVEKVSNLVKNLTPKSIEQEYGRMWLVACELADAEVEADYKAMKTRGEKVDIHKFEETYRQRRDLHLKNIMDLLIKPDKSP